MPPSRELPAVVPEGEALPELAPETLSAAPEGEALPELDLSAAEGELFLELKALRRKLADEKKLPAYIVFSDATLLQMATRRPTDEAGLLAVSGVGQKKLAQYGEAFLALLRKR